MEEDRLAILAEFMSILGVESRLRMVSLLAEYETLCVNALAARLGISQSAVSQHLRILHLKGLVTSERDGYYTHYSIDRSRLRGFLDMVSGLLEENGAERRARCVPEGGEVCAEEKTGAEGPKN